MNAAADASGSAVISADGLYRYELRRYWPVQQSTWALWIMLNPSTADAFEDDQTIRTIMRLTQEWNAAGVVSNCFGISVANLYAWRATDPMELLEEYRRNGLASIVGPDNDETLRCLIAGADTVMVAWGNGPFRLREMPFHRRRAAAVCSMIREAGKVPQMLELTKAQMPRHPLYASKGMRPVPYEAG